MLYTWVVVWQRVTFREKWLGRCVRRRPGERSTSDDRDRRVAMRFWPSDGLFGAAAAAGLAINDGG